MKKVCVVTGSRAEYGLLKFLMKGIIQTKKLKLQVIATGAHLSPEFGLTYKEIADDGIKINKHIEMLLSADTSSSISKSIGVGLIGFADALDELKPDIMVLQGDRFELLAACTASLFKGIPIAHISGGEITEGSCDEAIRHSITKMSWWHFVGAAEYGKRVIQLGENPKRVFHVGGLGVDTIKKTKLLSKKALMQRTGIKFGKKNLLVTYHPDTLEKNTLSQNPKALLNALNKFEDIYIIFTMPNADLGSRFIKKMVEDFIQKNKDRSILFKSMGHLNYLSTLQYVDGVVGNSSSGLAEAPTFKLGTINIGDRQKGRLKALSVIDCDPIESEITTALKKLYSPDFQSKLQSVKNPYGEGNASEKIIEVLTKSSIPENMKKVFYDL